MNINPEFWKREETVKLDVITLMAVHGNLLLALCHPQNIGESRNLIVKFCRKIGEHLVTIGAMTPGQLKRAYIEEGIPELLDTMGGVAPIPVFWKDEIEGKMAPIVRNFLENTPLGKDDLKILQWYMYQWIGAFPARPEDYRDVLKMSQEELMKYLHEKLLPLGIDPF